MWSLFLLRLNLSSLGFLVHRTLIFKVQDVPNVQRPIGEAKPHAGVFCPCPTPGNSCSESCKYQEQVEHVRVCRVGGDPEVVAGWVLERVDIYQHRLAAETKAYGSVGYSFGMGSIAAQGKSTQEKIFSPKERTHK